MKELEQIYFKSSESLRSWFEKNFDKSSGIWIMFYKKHVNKECVSYGEALDEALCFGWIDSIIKRIDKDKYVRKFTPRKNLSNWSEVNKNKVLALIKEGKMNEAGLNKIDIYLKTGKVDWKNEDSRGAEIKELEVPGFIKKEFAKHEPALTNFNKLARTFKKHYVSWITDAKRDKTLISRLKESIELLKENKKLGLK